MIGLGLRLTFSGGREAIARLALIVVAVAIGAGLLLAVLAGLGAVNTQNARFAWLNTGFAENGVTTTPAAPDAVLWQGRYDYYVSEQILRVDEAPTGPDTPVPPGLTRLPGPGEYYASPALARLITSTPADQLGDRFPGRMIGTIGRAGLPSPQSLIVVVGHTTAEMAGAEGVQKIARIETIDPSRCKGCQVGTPADGIDLILSVVAAALIFPLLIFIGTATRLSAARREQRFAAMRLVGATPRQIAVIATAESAVAAVIGMVLGFGFFALLRPVLAPISFTSAPFFESDLRLTWVDALVVALGIPIAAAVAARVALRRVRVSPLGVSRRVTTRPPRAWRLIPILLGVAEMVYLVGHRPPTTDGQIAQYLTGIFAIMIGLVVAGPWLTMVGARLLSGRARRVATLIAGRRLADHPKTGFRAVSGLMLALFVTAVATGVIGTMNHERADPPLGSTQRSALTMTFGHEGQKVDLAGAKVAVGAVPGVRGTLVTYANPRFHFQVFNGAMPSVASCAELAAFPEFGRCEPGAQVAGVYAGLSSLPDEQSPIWETDPAHLAGLPVDSLIIVTDGQQATIERARTVTEKALPSGEFPSTGEEWELQTSRQLLQWQQLADVVIVASLAIAGCNLAVSVVGGLSERRRPFSLLRLTGVRLPTLRSVVALESAVPLLLVAVLATGAGLLVAHLFVRSEMNYSLHWPGPSYFLLVVGGLVVSLGVIASTLPVLRRITGPETARNE